MKLSARFYHNGSPTTAMTDAKVASVGSEYWGGEGGQKSISVTFERENRNAKLADRYPTERLRVQVTPEEAQALIGRLEQAIAAVNGMEVRALEDAARRKGGRQ